MAVGVGVDTGGCATGRSGSDNPAGPPLTLGSPESSEATGGMVRPLFPAGGGAGTACAGGPAIARAARHASSCCAASRWNSCWISWARAKGLRLGEAATHSPMAPPGAWDAVGGGAAADAVAKGMAGG